MTTKVHANGPISIVASLSIVADFASQISEGLYSVPSIVTGTENPHIYEPTPSEIELVATADLQSVTLGASVDPSSIVFFILRVKTICKEEPRLHSSSHTNMTVAILTRQ